MRPNLRAMLIKNIQAILSDPWSDKRHLAEMANISKDFFDKLTALCARYGVKSCRDCGQFTAPGYKHYCPDFDREKGQKIPPVRTGKYTH